MIWPWSQYHCIQPLPELESASRTEFGHLLWQQIYLHLINELKRAMARLGAFCFPGTGHLNPMTALAKVMVSWR